MFNYIITIHNKQAILEMTMEGVAACCSRESAIYPVLDGCTDRSEEIVDKFIEQSDLKVEKVITPDVHEIKSINAALRKIDGGFTICLQDDVILQEPKLEEKVEKLYEKEGSSLGYVSFCRAANLRRTGLLRQFRTSSPKPLVEEINMVKAPHDPLLSKAEIAEYEEIMYRMVAIKSPVCIPEIVLKAVGILDENMAPYSWDDHEYSIRCLKAGFRNALFPLRFRSDLEWGGTRIDKSFSYKSKPIHVRNRRYIWRKHGQFIGEYLRNMQRICQE